MRHRIVPIQITSPGFWQADPLVGIVIVLFLFREGYAGWTEAGDTGEDDGE
jgi:divalent metal cation (Fe/Co/Zn/Cd) transporter